MSVLEVLKKNGKLVDDFLFKMLSLGASNELYEIAKYQVDAGGKRLRPAMAILSCEAVGGNAELAIPAAVGVELVHNYTLILDDIIDRSDLRRGLPTIRAKYGDVMAILAGMHYREAVFEATRKSPNSGQVEEVLSAALKRIIEGERLDVLFEQAGRESEYLKKMRYTSISEKDYFGMVEAKTAVLFDAACKAGGLVGDATSEQIAGLSSFGWNCGVAFQLVDDILDIGGKKEEFGKEIGKDIREHKLGNIVVLYGLKELSDVERNRFLSIIRAFKSSDSQVDEATRILLSTNAVKRAWATSRDYVAEAKSHLKFLSDSEAKRILIDIADFIVERSF